jgi:DNA repair exonuclease SbcCD ATPase subunit
VKQLLTTTDSNIETIKNELNEYLEHADEIVEYRKLYKLLDKKTAKLWKLQRICCNFDIKDTLKQYKHMKCDEYETYNNQTARQVEIEKDLIVLENKILKLKTCERRNEDVIKVFENYITNRSDYEKYDELRKELQSVVKDIKSKEHESIEVEKQRIEIEHMNKVMEKYSKQLNEEEMSLQRYLLLVNIYTKHGVVDKILCNRIVPELEAGVNDLLRTVTDFQIKITYNGSGLCIERINKTAEGEVTHINAKLLSGFEHDVLNLIFKIKFNQLNAFIKTDFLVLDEVLSSADDTHLNKLEHLFSYIKEHYKWCLLITHLGAMKNYFTQTISIERTNGFSKINVK